MKRVASGDAAVTFQGGADEDAFSIIGSDGRVRDGPPPTIGDQRLLDGFRWMLFSRTFDERAVALQRQGRLGTYSPAIGQEATVVGTALALEPGTDWIVPQYRETAAILMHGYPLREVLLYWKGSLAGLRIPRDVRVAPIQIALAAQLPHAVGLAHGLRMQGRKDVVVTYCGDGASSEGDFHEACNFAGVLKAPVVLVIQNNGYALSTPRSSQTAAESLACRAVGYGLCGVKVDGNDLIAVYEATRQAVTRARDGQGPTLIEAQTYRLFSHNTADDHTRYVPQDELELRRRQDPIPRLRSFLCRSGLLSEDLERSMQTEIELQISTAVDEAESCPRSAPEQLFEHTMANNWPRLARQERDIMTAGTEAD